MADFVERVNIQEVISDIYKDADSAVEGACIEIWSRVKEIPAADVRPVVRGKWEQTKDEFGFYNKCSVCGKEYYCGPIAPFNFCPNCGADMREVNKSGN